MDRDTAAANLSFVRSVVERTHARVDSHAFHSVIWGSIVLVWYPLAHWFGSTGRLAAMAWLGGGAVALGVALSWWFEWRLSRKPRLPGENTFIAKQIVMIVYPLVAAGSVLSIVGPVTGAIPGPHVPLVWGFVYAVMAFMIGVVYTAEYLVAGIAIFFGTVAALLLPDVSGYILGACMGVGMIVPGIIAERRVAALRAADGDA